MNEAIHDVLDQIGDHTHIQTLQPISGGDINQAFYVQTKNSEYFMKGNQQVPSHFFKAEAKGLELIRQTNTVHVPQVYYYDEPLNGSYGMMAMDWIEGKQTPATVEGLGEKLALMHQTTNQHFGYGDPTFIGKLNQPNQWTSTWLDYYRDFRLQPQLELAIENNRLPIKRRAQLETVISRLDEWINHAPKASLLHGDLWGGNWMTGPHGHPYVIDPSVLYGDHAFEIAFTELFGGFPASFYNAYKEIFPLPPHYADMKPLYQLFYLLVHLNLFGEMYGPSVDRILTHYAG